MAKLKIVYWHDIPGQVVMRIGRRNERLRLSSKFAEAIDRASNRLKKQGKDALFDPWQVVDRAFQGNIHIQARLLVTQIEENYSNEILDRLIRSGGVDELCLKNA